MNMPPPSGLSLAEISLSVTGFALANPKLAGEREQARAILQRQPANRPVPGTAVVTDKGLAGEDIEAFFAGPDPSLVSVLRQAEPDDLARRGDDAHRAGPAGRHRRCSRTGTFTCLRQAA